MMILSLIASCLIVHVSANCPGAATPGAARKFNVGESRLAVRSSIDKAMVKLTIDFFPFNGAAFELDGFLDIENMALPSSCDSYGFISVNALDDVCENNGGRISCELSTRMVDPYVQINSTCLPAGTTLDFDISIETRQWGTDRESVQLCLPGTVEVQGSFTSNTGNSSKHFNTTTVF